LDEKGAEIKSESQVSLTKDAEEEVPKPKRMRFDKPFFVMLKRADRRNPYFGLWTKNAELMEKIDK